MPPMTRDDVDDLNMFVKAGRIDEARALLESLDGEKAQSALKRLNDRYPPAPKAAPSQSNSIAAAKRLIAQKDYDAAEKLLWDSDDPAAGDLLRKLALVKSADVKSSPDEKTPVKTKSGNKSGRKLMLYALLVVLFLLVVVVLVPSINDMNAQADAINRAIEARR